MGTVIFLPISIISLCLLINVARTLLEISKRAISQKHARARPSHRSCPGHDDAASASGLRVLKYAYEVKVPGLDEVVECPFCLSGDVEQGDEIRVLKCEHLFHGACLDKWLMLARPATCPLCRSAVSPVETAPSSWTTTGEQFGLDDEENDDDSLTILFSYVDVNGCFSRICEKLRGWLDVGQFGF